MQLLVNEVFQSIQGEGSHTGVPSIFVRLQGCPVGCPWCDTKHTWETKPEHLVDEIIVMQESEESEKYFSTDEDGLFDLFERQGYTAKHIVLTGGEPCMFELNAITEMAHERGFSTQIETSGTFEIKCSENTWVTLSPKINMRGKFEILPSAVHRANEIKHPVAMQKHVDELLDLLKVLEDSPTPVIYLQPISMQKRATEFAIDTCIKRNWRLSVQTHKFIGVE